MRNKDEERANKIKLEKRFKKYIIENLDISELVDNVFDTYAPPWLESANIIEELMNDIDDNHHNVIEGITHIPDENFEDSRNDSLSIKYLGGHKIISKDMMKKLEKFYKDQ